MQDQPVQLTIILDSSDAPQKTPVVCIHQPTSWRFWCVARSTRISLDMGLRSRLVGGGFKKLSEGGRSPADDLQALLCHSD
jgi:hypothetical protein